MASSTSTDKDGIEIDRFRSRADGKAEYVRARVPWASVVPLDGEGKVSARLTANFMSHAVKLLELPAGMSQPYHPAPEPQFVVVLRGRLEVQTSGDRELKSWGPGEFFIASDHDGIGHETRVIGDEPALLMFVPLGSLDLDGWTKG